MLNFTILHLASKNVISLRPKSQLREFFSIADAVAGSETALRWAMGKRRLQPQLALYPVCTILSRDLIKQDPFNFKFPGMYKIIAPQHYMESPSQYSLPRA